MSGPSPFLWAGSRHFHGGPPDTRVGPYRDTAQPHPRQTRVGLDGWTGSTSMAVRPRVLVSLGPRSGEESGRHRSEDTPAGRRR